MRKFMDEDFLLTTDTAKKLYHNYAKNEPIFDFHCHLSPKEIYEDHEFENITEAWLGGDHYKWRLLRAFGYDEKFITGDADSREKFRAFAKTLSHAIGNPIYHWSHLELQRFFGIYDVLDEDSADRIYDMANEKLKKGLTARKMMEMSKVRAVFTTDDPCDSLEWHDKIKNDNSFDIEVRPAFRPDRFIHIENSGYDMAVHDLSKVSGLSINCFDELLLALDKRVEYFAEHGCKASDHAFSDYSYKELSNEELNKVFMKGVSGRADQISKDELDGYQTALILHLAKKYHSLGWPMELHVQPIRNNNPKMFKKIGADSGFDSILDGRISKAYNSLLGKMAENDELPATVLFSLNPSDLCTLATMIGNFQEGPICGKMQLGVPWWFNDTKDGMFEHLHVLANEGIISTCIGMLTDSRSFLSYARHEYFRRILCEFMGSLIENGEYPDRLEFVGEIVRKICFSNAIEYFGL